MKNIIVHIPYTLNEARVSGSQIRPLKMLNAFESIGYNIDVVIGNGKQRKEQIDSIKKKVCLGTKYDFLYSESSTIPTLLTESHHLPSFPFLDFSFFSFCRKYSIPIGLFYRDIYWQFEAYKKSLPFFKVLYSRFFYKYDLRKYNALVDKVYLPSIEMADYIPYIDRNKFCPLPPGHDNPNIKSNNKVRNDRIKILYVGGVSVNYKLHILFESIRDNNKFELIVCTRLEDWERSAGEYRPLLSDNIKVVHLSGARLADLYSSVDIAALFVQPSIYRKFAFPVKLVEYLGYGKPIIASCNTLAGNFVNENDIGWSIDYSKKDLDRLLQMISGNLDTICLKEGNVKKIIDLHSWIGRAKKVETDLVLNERNRKC